MTDNISLGTAGFYEEFKKYSENLLDTLNHSYIISRSLSQQTRGVITNIPRGNKPRH